MLESAYTLVKASSEITPPKGVVPEFLLPSNKFVCELNLNPPVVVGLSPLLPIGNFIACVEVTISSPDVVKPNVPGVLSVAFSICTNSRSTFFPLTVCLKFRLRLFE